MASAGLTLDLHFGPLPPELERLSTATAADVDKLERRFPSLRARKFSGNDFVRLVTVREELPAGGVRVNVVAPPFLKKLDRALAQMRQRP